jgi:predicted MFS family arabinose efflux permease
LAIFLREPVQHNQNATEQESVGAALRVAFRHRGFWLLNMGFFACGFQLAFIATHLPAYLLDKGLSVHHGATALACIALANVFGMYFAGRSIGYLRTKYVLAHVYLTRVVAMLMFISFPVTVAGTYAFAALMGFLWLGTAPLTNNLVVRIFGVRYVATLFGIVFFGHQLGSFLGVWLGGYVYDVYRSYDLLWLISIAVGLVSALLHLGINDHPRFAGSPLARTGS